MMSFEIGSEQPNGIENPGLADHSGVASEILESILFVDDDPNILAAFQRQFRNTFTIETAIGPEEGLSAIASKGPFAVVISDLRMPGMSGIQFLATVRAKSPDTVRVMLTGQADMSDAIAAINQGAIFRFLVKPSSATILGKVIEAALEQHRLIVAERQLTQQTLVGCVEILSEILSIVEPVAFSRTNRVLGYVRQLTGALDLASSWQVEAAAMLSHVGWITIPADIAAKRAASQPLSPEESLRFHQHPIAAARIVGRIPRLQTVAKIIEAQFTPYQSIEAALEPGAPRDPVTFGAAILQAAIDFDERRSRGLSDADALADMRSRADLYHPDVISAMGRIEEIKLAEQTKVVPVSDLAPGMVLNQDLCARNGMCMIASGQKITLTSLERLRGLRHTMDTDLTVSVRSPDSEPL
jgi:FixJ family two-component response regulator